MRSPSCSSRSRGFTLIELAVVLVIASLMVAAFLGITGTVQASAHRSAAEDRLRAVDAALVHYVTLAKRLPCPADGALASSAAGAGEEQRDGAGDCLNSQERGVVPWRTLGLKEEEASDPYGGRFTYRVALGLTRANALDWTTCDPAGSSGAVGTAPNQSCRPICPTAASTNCCAADYLGDCTSVASIVSGRGFAIQSPGGATVATSVAYVLISHGENRAGGYAMWTGKAQGQVGAAPGAGEIHNAAANALQAYYVESTPTTSHDDIMVRTGVLALAMRAGVGPRQQLTRKPTV